MHCPHCGSDKAPTEPKPGGREHPAHPVLETRRRDEQIVRRRHCETCGKDFQTSESVSALGLRVRKADGSVVPFSEEVIRRGIRRAAVRPERFDRLEPILQRVIGAARALADAGVVSSLAVGGLVLRELRDLDHVSHIRYAIVHLGRRDRSGHPGWGTIGEFRQWLVVSYPDLQHYRPPVHLTTVAKRDLTREPFSQRKLEESIALACRGREPVSEGVDVLAQRIAADVLSALGEQPLVTSGQISAHILQSLREQDPIAFLRYASTAKGYLGPEDYEAEAVALRRHE